MMTRMSESDIQDGVYAGEFAWVGMIREDLQALLASTFPVKPPSAWFVNPALKMPTPLTITNEGHVMGHLATWKQQHIGMAGSVKAPKSRSNYAFFATGVIECDDGKQVNVGNITLTGGHAPLEASVTDVISHYDNTDSAVMDVAIGEDSHGIWVAGALRPEVTDSQLRRIRASGVSGDWRPINGNLELVAACCVNVPGFPIPRAMVAGGKITALTAAGTAELVQARVLEQFGVELESAVIASLGGMNERITHVEAAILGRARAVRDSAQVAQAVAQAKSLKAVQASGTIEELRSRVRPEAGRKVKRDSDALVASLRDRTQARWEDGFTYEATTQDVLVAALRQRKEGITAGGRKLDSEARDQAAKSGVAMKNGSFPVRDRRDFDNARRAIGRAADPKSAARHVRKRGRALGVPAAEVRTVGL